MKNRTVWMSYLESGDTPKIVEARITRQERQYSFGKVVTENGKPPAPVPEELKTLYPDKDLEERMFDTKCHPDRQSAILALKGEVYQKVGELEAEKSRLLNAWQQFLDLNDR